MDNYELSNLPLLSHCADSEESHPWLTDEENRRATFSRRSVTVSTSERTELQGYLSTGDEQIPKQRVLTDFDISLASDILDPLVDKPEDPFALLAAYRPLTFNDDSQHLSDSELGLGLSLFEGFIAEDFTDVQAEPEGNDILKQPEQSQGESDTKGIIIFESAIPDTVSDNRSGKRRAPEPRNVLIRGIPKSSIEHSIELHFRKSLGRSKRLTRKRQKLDSTDTEFLPLPRGMATESRAATMPEKSASYRTNTKRQNLDESLRKRVKEETNKWIVEYKGLGKRFMCSYPDCGWTCSTRGNLQVHIFRHIQISSYKCPYPECADYPYFGSSSNLTRHVLLFHKKERPYHCTLCDRRFGRIDHYKRHMRNKHKIAA